MKKGKKTTRRNAKRRTRNPLRRIPSYMLWGLLTVVVLIYVVFFYRTFVSPYSYRWKALYGTVSYPEGKVRGIDVSHYQEEIDWKRLRRAQLQGEPISFIFVKATEGTDIIDEYFNLNFFNARKHNIVRGAYHFYSTKSPASRQADFFCKIVQLEDDDLPPVLDVEHIGELTPQKLRREVKTWLDRVEHYYGVTPILYTSYKFKTNYLNTADFDRYPYWIAHYYVDSLSYKGAWSFWQHTDAGRVDGISGYVDVNVFNGSFDQLVSLTLGQQRPRTEKGGAIQD